MMRTICLTAMAAVLAAAVPVACAQEAGFNAPRTPDGKPDLQGVWTNASVTGLQRGAQYTSLTVSEEQALRVQAQQYAANQRAQRPTDQSTGAPTDRNTSAGYNRFWVDPGATLGKVKGTFRSSWIVDPPNGQMPVSAGGQAIRAEIRRRTGAGNFDGPETRPMGERCLIGFGGTGGPPMLNVLYNNHYQIVQTPDHLMIMVEMNHDARIVPIAKSKAQAKHKPDAIKPWLGDAVGWWEGDTLVVETKNFHPTQIGKTSVLVTEAGKVTERFTRWSEDQILYEFTVEDPRVYTRPWKGEMSLNRDDERVYEYACHEGNYALHGILAGAREEERAGGTRAAVEDDEG
jgi:hypothetical protein